MDDALVVPASHVPAPGPEEGIGPGAQLITYVEEEDAWYLCSANFVWSDGDELYLGSAGHCFLPEGANATHGPNADYDVSGGRALVCVASCVGGGMTGSVAEFVGVSTFVELGDVVYARQVHETGLYWDEGGIGSDFALVVIPEALYPLVRADVPLWGGPAGVAAAPIPSGEVALTYGNGVFAAETFATKGRAGVTLAIEEWWTVLVDGVGKPSEDEAWWAVLPGTPGDSGSGVVLADPEAGGHGADALGILTHGGRGNVMGTLMPRAVAMAAEAGLHVEPVFAEEAPPVAP